MNDLITPWPDRPAELTPLCREPANGDGGSWRTDLPRGVEPARLEALLVRRGWEPTCRHPTLKVLRHPGGHQLAWAVATGRAHLHLARAVPAAQRPRRAEILYQDLAACVRFLLQTPRSSPLETPADELTQPIAVVRPAVPPTAARAT